MSQALGRPTDYSPEVADRLCELVLEGRTVTQACEAVGIDKSTVYRWLRTHLDFRDKYARAREEAAHANADDVQEVALRVMDGKLPPDAGRVVIDALKWTAGKRKPKTYGDRQIVDVGDDTLKQLSDERVDSRILELIGKTGVAKPPGRAAEAETGELS